MAAKADQMILVNGDAKVPYQFVAQGMAILRSAGATKIGFVTEPGEAKRPKH
jgi:biopolymer transport protein TolR